MSFSDKKKKRIKDIAVIIKNSKKMSAEMTSINNEYEQELLEVVESILSLNNPKEESAVNSSLSKRPKRSKKPFRSKLFKKGIVPYNDSSVEKSDGIEQYIDKTKMPDWCKDLWRKIMVKCHPDKLIHEVGLSNADLAERSQIMIEASESIEEEDWDNLIYLAALIDGFTEKLKFNQQVNQLNKINNKNSKTILEIQNSLTWHWGISWSVPTKRLTILKHVLKIKNITIPSDATLKNIINSLE